MNQPQRRLTAVPDHPRISQRTARQELALRKIQERQASAPHGEGTIDPVTTGSYIDIDRVLKDATKYVIVDSPIPLWRRLLRWWRSL